MSLYFKAKNGEFYLFTLARFIGDENLHIIFNPSDEKIKKEFEEFILKELSNKKDKGIGEI